MPRPAKAQEFLHCRLDQTLSQELTAYANSTKRTRTAVVEMALAEFFERHPDDDGQGSTGTTESDSFKMFLKKMQENQ